MPDNNYIYEKGTIFVAPGGGSAPVPLAPGVDGQVVVADSSTATGLGWESVPGTGDVVGPGSAVDSHLAAFDSTTGKLIKDSLIALANVVQGPASVVDNHLPRYDGTTGKLLQTSGIEVADTDVMTFPAGAGPVLTTGGGAARKGTFTFSSGSSGDISTTSVATGSVIAVTITALGTVTAPQAFYVVITNATKFVIHSADATDTSSGTWAIVA